MAGAPGPARARGRPTAEEPPGPELPWALEPTRSGDTTMRLGGRLVHSGYDPGREAERWARRRAEELRGRGARASVLVGRGLDRLAPALARAWPGRLLVWDAFPGVSAAAGLPRAAAGAHATVTDETGLRTALRGLAADGVDVCVHPGYEGLARLEARLALRALRHRTGAVRLAAEHAHADDRAREGLARLAHRRRVEALRPALEGATVVVVGNGPTLRHAKPALRAPHRALVAGAVQVLCAFAGDGIPVHLGVICDPRDLFPLFDPEGRGRCRALLADTSCHPAVLDRWPERTFLFHLRTRSAHQLAWEAAGMPVIDEPVATVTETAACLARELGAARVLLVGCDYASPRARYTDRVTALDARGREVATTPAYLHAGRWLSHAAPAFEAAGCELRRLGDGAELALPAVPTLAPDALDAWLAASREPGPMPDPVRGFEDPALARAARHVLADVDATRRR